MGKKYQNIVRISMILYCNFWRQLNDNFNLKNDDILMEILFVSGKNLC